MRNPYRTAEEREREPPHFEDRVVEIVLLVVGVIGVAVGLYRPERGIELTAGIFLVCFVLRGWALRSSRDGSLRKRRTGSDS